MKIVIMVAGLNTGGAERTAVSLANWLANQKEEVYLINLGINDNNYEISKKVKLYNKEQGNNIFLKIKSSIKLLKYLNDIKPDVIFEMLFSPIKYCVIHKIFNRKVAIIGSERNNPKQRYKTLKLKFLCQICPILCDGYIFQTIAVKEMFSKNIQKKSIVIGNAISNPNAYNIEKEYNNEKIIVSAGRLTYQKGYDILIKAFNKVYQNYPEYKLVIYGEDNERKQLEDLIKELNLEDNVLLPGKNKNYLKKVAESEIFVLSSRYEGMPNVLLEAMSIGMPCISTDCVAGPAEIIEDNVNGLLVEVNNVEQLASKIEFLINNKSEAKRIGINAKKIKDNFSMEIIFGKFHNYFRKIYEEKNSGNMLLKRIFMKLRAMGITNIIPDKIYLKILYKLKMNSKLNIKNPKTFNEKLQWLKLYDRRPGYIKMVDKKNVKEYVSEIIGSQYIIPTIGIYDKVEDINFKMLPEKFVMKCTHDSGSTVICKNKKNFDDELYINKLRKALKINYFYQNREWPYKNVRPKILIEKYMEDYTGNLLDYKIYAFNGKCDYVMVCLDREKKNEKTKFIYFDKNWNMKKEFSEDGKKYGDKIQVMKPDNLEKMFEFASILSKGIPFVRVDFYEIDGKLYFGELTFFPSGGFDNSRTKECEDFLDEALKIGDIT